MSDVFPPRNLSGLADAWGRAVENRIKDQEVNSSRTAQDVNNALRANSGQLSVVSSQVSELVSRSIYPFSVPNIAVTGGVGTNSSVYNVMIQGTGELRRAQFSVNLEATVPSGANFLNMFLEVTFEGAVVARSVGKPSPTTTGPSGWPQFTSNASGFILVPPAGALLTVRVFRTGGTGAPTNTLTASGFGSVFFGDTEPTSAGS